jgi:hypothetical protein
MLDSVLEVFALKPDWDLDIMTPRQTLSTITSKCLLGMDEAIDALKPDMILVHGDTSTTFAGALSAFYHQVPVGHVEAGLRTYDKYSPFPEEMNRKLVSAIADLYFCPTANNRNNLLREGITDGLFVTGNTVIDALRTNGAQGLSLYHDGNSEYACRIREENLPGDLPPPGELRRAHEEHHAGPAPDRRGERGRGAGVSRASFPGGAGGGPRRAGRPRVHLIDRCPPTKCTTSWPGAIWC